MKEGGDHYIVRAVPLQHRKLVAAAQHYRK